MSTQDNIESVRREFRADSKILTKDPDQHETLKIKFDELRKTLYETFV